MRTKLRVEYLKNAWREIPSLFRYWGTWRSSGDGGGLLLGISRSSIFLACRVEVLRLPELYQPIEVPGFDDLVPQRPCVDRLDLIVQDIGESAGSINDIGCQIGYFSFSLARRGFQVRAYDMNSGNIRIANMLSELSLGPKPLFIHFPLEIDTAPFMEQADYTLCLAVFHHIIYYQGISVAQELISIIREKTRKKLYFEIGQSNELVEPWANHIPDMGSDPLTWITDFLRSGGFNDVKVLGMVSTHVSSVPRYLVVAS